MADVVVTVPKWFGLDTWIAEGDAAGEPESGQEWDFYCGGALPDIDPGERVYVVFNNAIRGYAPLVHLQEIDYRRFSFVRRGRAIAVTIPEVVRGFQGWRYRWWDTAIEQPFPDWKNPTAQPIHTRSGQRPPSAAVLPHEESA